jgi:ketosteroid isomerase-like protein
MNLCSVSGFPVLSSPRRCWRWLAVFSAFSLALLAPAVTAAASRDAGGELSPADARVICEGGDKQFTVGLSQENPTLIAALYASDALLQAPGGTEATRREHIGQFWQNMMDGGATGLAMSIDAIAIEGGLIIETGRYALISGNVGVVETGKYLIVRKRESGHWRIFRHIWNASAPTAGRS